MAYRAILALGSLALILPACYLGPYISKRLFKSWKGIWQDVMAGLIGLLILCGTAILLSAVMMGPWMPDTVRYSLMYSTDADHVYVAKEPKDCEWGYAPIGDKGCHYDKNIAVDKPGKGGLPSVYVTWTKIKE